MRETGRLQGTYTSGINERLEISGEYADQNGVNHPFLRFADGHVEKFDVQGAGTGAGQGAGAANINHEGDVIGNYLDASGPSYGFLRYQADGRIIPFGVPNAAGVFPSYNNTNNAIVGYYLDANYNVHAFLRTSPDLSER